MRLLALALTALLSAPAASAGQTWTAEAQAGRLRYDVGGGLVESANAGLGVRYIDRRSWAQLMVGVPLTRDEQLWGCVGSWQRVAARRGALTFGVDLTGHACGSRQQVRVAGGLLDPATTSTVTGIALSGQALPLLAWSSGGLTLEGRAGIAHTVRDADDNRLSRSVRLGEVSVQAMATSNLVLSASAVRFDADEASYTRAGLGVFLIAHPVQLRATAGHWFDAGENATPWAVGASVRLVDRVGLELSGRRETLDPLYGAPPRTTWSVGLSYTLVAPPRAAEPVPALYVDGRATIELPMDEVEGHPSLAGDFNDWTPAPMAREGDAWTYAVRVDPGVYQYAFVAEDGTWFVPESVPGRRKDGMGGYVAVLVVR